MPSKVPEGETRGWIVPIGGAENKENDRRILRAFRRRVAAALTPTSSSSRPRAGSHETGPRYEQLFRELGAARVTVDGLRHAPRLPGAEPPASGSSRRAASSSPAATSCGSPRCSAARRSRKLIRSATPHGVHGRRHQRRRQHPERAHDRVRRRRARRRDRRQRARSRRASGLTNRFVIDQHFRQRDRLGRLLTALAYNPFAIGIGLDEDTAAFIGPDETAGGRRQRRRHDRGRRRTSSSPRWTASREGAAGLPARPQAAHPGRRRDVQPAHADAPQAAAG